MPRPIGFVASDATESRCTVVLMEGEEHEVKNEDLVIINNAAGRRRLLAVCRGGRGINDGVRAMSYSPAIGYARAGRKPSSAREYFTFNLSIIGDVTDGKISQNRYIIAPASEVQVFTDDDNPMELLGGEGLTLGYYAGHRNWRIPIKREYINYHVGIFGITGSGKSLLTRYEIVPLLSNSGYRIILFDWKGSDYAPYFSEVINLEEIHMSTEVIIKYLSSITRDFGYLGREENPVANAVETALRHVDWREAGDPAKAKRIIYEYADSLLAAASGVKDDTKRLQRERLASAMDSIEDDEIAKFMGRVRPEEIVNMARERGIIVIDMSKGSKHQKLAAFLAVARYLKKLMERKEMLNFALIIDEAPQYAPWRPVSLEVDTTDTLIELCALGRSYGLAIILLSQGMSGEIGINAAVRRNLNTQLVGRIHPLDMEEAQKLMSSYFISTEALLSLPPGHFYLVGRMNPSPIPLLLSFDIGS